MEDKQKKLERIRFLYAWARELDKEIEKLRGELNVIQDKER